MTPRLAVGLATLNAPELLNRCVRSVLDQDGITPDDVMVVMNGPRVADQCALWEARGVHVQRFGANVGTCRAWNYLCRRAFGEGYDGILIVGDDLELLDHRTIRKFQEALAPNLRQMRFVQDRGFSGVCVTRVVWEEIGCFDECLAPAYYEDNDYFYRFHNLAGISWEHVLVDSRHEGSASLKQDQGFADAVAVAFRMNAEYFQAKWGGMPHHETYTVPWNGGEPMAGTLDRLPEHIRRVLECRYA